VTTSQPAPTSAVLRRVVELAQRAPSVHNTQPWRWRGSGGTLELYADRSRQLTLGDPDGRDLVISCGAVLHHLQVVAGALGWETSVERLPGASPPELLARVELSSGTPPRDADALLEAVERRCTDRRRFTSWPVPDERLTHLAAQATAWRSRALPLTDMSERFRAELLVNRAFDRQAKDREMQAEQAAWVDHGATDGVPSAVLPAPQELLARRSSRFTTGLLDDIGGRELEGSDGLIVICALDDDVEAWLHAGEALSAMWLTATTQGLSVVPLSQVIELAETRDALRLEVLGGLAHPLILVRVGWQAISRSQLPRTPRLPIDEVLELV
jgi:nitroreductase